MRKVRIIVLTVLLTATAMVSTSAEIMGSKPEQPVKNQVRFASEEKVTQVVAFTEARKQAVIDAIVAEEARVAKEKADAIAAEKAKQDLLDKQAADKQKAADQAKALEAQRIEANRLALIAANKAKQIEIDRIAAERADKAKQAQIAENLRIAKAASDKAEQEAAAKLAKIEADRLAKVEADRIAKELAASQPKTEAEKQAKVEADRLAKIEADRLAKIEADRILAAQGLHQTAIQAKLAAYLSSSDNIISVLNRAVELHGGDYSNNCVYFSSEAMRRIGGANVPLSMCNTGVYTNYLKGLGWVSSYDIKKLTPGSICFTTPGWGGSPTHTFAFMGWVTSGNYTLANVADNQGNAVHVRNMGATDSTDAFAYFMHN